MELPTSLSQSTDELDSKMANINTNSSIPTVLSTDIAATIGEHYDTSHPKRGIALVINQVNFNSMNQRDGSDKDRDCISSSLKRIGFDVRILNDPNRKELLATLATVANEDHSQNDCLVVVVMTHGKENNLLYAKDKSYEADKLWEPFIGSSCPSLRGKPKLFFVQACRGKKLDQGVKLVKMAVDQTVSVDSAPESVSYVIPTMADLLVMYSSYDGHYSWRNPVNGSWFIQSLSLELNANAHCQELLHILTAVSRRVAYHYESNVPNNAKLDAMKQMPCIVSMLTKLLYFPSKA
uniref:Caspase n=1 Tax=Anopheles maculatus TaxID=74869 RepID=A0A182SDY5_9DIPT